MLNRVILMGRLTADPEHKVTPAGVSVTSFSIAVERNYVDKATNQRQADFINIVAWRGTADLICKYFPKGSMIALEGSLQTRTYDDKNGNKRYVSEVIADNVYFTGSKNEQGRGQGSADTSFPTPPPASFDEPQTGAGFSVGGFEEIEVDEGDLPF